MDREGGADYIFFKPVRKKEEEPGNFYLMMLGIVLTLCHSIAFVQPLSENTRHTAQTRRRH